MSALKRLIVNAEGLGRTPGVNRGVIEAHRRGIVTSATLLVGQAASAEAAELARQTPALGIGLEVAFTGGSPALPPERVSSLVDGQGRLRARLEDMGSPRPEEVLAEARAQLKRFRELTGRQPTHLISHDHEHQKTEALEALLTLAWETGLPVRNASREVGERLRREGIRTTDGFNGEFRGEAATLEALVSILGGLSLGTTELACHPAVVDDELRASEAQAEARGHELQALTHREARQILQAAGVRLIHFGDL